MSENLKALNKANAEKQTALYDAYLLSIKDVREEHDAKLKAITEQYNKDIKIFNDAYMESIAPEYNATAAKVNPEVEKLKTKLEAIKEYATSRTNKELQKFSKWQDKVLEELKPQIADRLEAFEKNIKPFREAHDKLVEEQNKLFDEITRPDYEKYIEAAKRIEDEFIANAAKKAKEEGKYDIKTDERVFPKNA